VVGREGKVGMKITKKFIGAMLVALPFLVLFLFAYVDGTLSQLGVSVVLATLIICCIALGEWFLHEN